MGSTGGPNGRRRPAAGRGQVLVPEEQDQVVESAWRTAGHRPGLERPAQVEPGTSAPITPVRGTTPSGTGSRSADTGPGLRRDGRGVGGHHRLGRVQDGEHHVEPGSLGARHKMASTPSSTQGSNSAGWAGSPSTRMVSAGRVAPPVLGSPAQAADVVGRVAQEGHREPPVGPADHVVEDGVGGPRTQDHRGAPHAAWATAQASSKSTNCAVERGLRPRSTGPSWPPRTPGSGPAGSTIPSRGRLASSTFHP